MGMRLELFACIGFITCIFTGCATLIFDRYDKVDIVTEPMGVAIYDKEGFNIGITPVQIPFKRLPRQQLTLKKNGYVDTTIVMSTSVNPWAALPFLFFLPESILYIAPDALLGGTFKKSDGPYVIRMKNNSADPMPKSIEHKDREPLKPGQ
tara:strand:+ start:416 stop:868 length:453 start_codon:yes stop_codon:yes gene_type:complete